MAGKSAPQRHQDQQRRCDELLAAYQAKQRKRQVYESSSPGRRQAIAQLADLLSEIRRRQRGQR